MSKVSKESPITQAELEAFGVSMSITIKVGDKTISSSVSPVDYNVFRRGTYKDELWRQIIERLDWDLNETK